MTDNAPLTRKESARRSPEQILRQAPVEPVPDDGVRVFSIGTALFVTATIVLQLGRDQWDIPQWWLKVGLSGIVIGVLATVFSIWRRNRRPRRIANTDPTPAT